LSFLQERYGAWSPPAQVSRMPRPVKISLFVVICGALLVDVVFVGWATKLNLLIVVPVALSAVYLCYFAAHYTIFEGEKR